MSKKYIEREAVLSECERGLKHDNRRSNPHS